MSGSIKKGGSRKILGSSRQRITTQRALLLDLLRQGKGHMDADELYHKARQKNPQISLSTVYRNLQLFKQLGFIAERHFSEEHHYYEIKSRPEHQHLLCLGCGRVIEFSCPISQQLKENISKQYSFEITGVEVHMTGFCPKCLQKSEY